MHYSVLALSEDSRASEIADSIRNEGFHSLSEKIVWPSGCQDTIDLPSTLVGDAEVSTQVGVRISVPEVSRNVEDSSGLAACYRTRTDSRWESVGGLTSRRR